MRIFSQVALRSPGSIRCDRPPPGLHQAIGIDEIYNSSPFLLSRTCPSLSMVARHNRRAIRDDRASGDTSGTVTIFRQNSVELLTQAGRAYATVRLPGLPW